MHARNASADPLGRFGGSQRADPDQNEHLVEQSQVFHAIHEGAQQRHVETELRLDKLCTGGDFLRQALRAPLDRFREGIFRRTEEHARRMRDLAAREEVVLVAQRPRGLEQRQRVEIEHRQRLRVVARLHPIARQAQEIADPHRRAAENVALDGDAVLVAA